MKETSVLKKNRDMVTRTIDDETILMPLYKTSDDINCIYTLNDVGGRIWELINGKRTLVKIKEILSEEFEATKQQMDKELDKFLKELKSIKAIRE